MVGRGKVGKGLVPRIAVCLRHRNDLLSRTNYLFNLLAAEGSKYVPRPLSTEAIVAAVESTLPLARRNRAGFVLQLNHRTVPRKVVKLYTCNVPVLLIVTNERWSKAGLVIKSVWGLIIGGILV